MRSEGVVIAHRASEVADPSRQLLGLFHRVLFEVSFPGRSYRRRASFERRAQTRPISSRDLDYNGRWCCRFPRRCTTTNTEHFAATRSMPAFPTIHPISNSGTNIGTCIDTKTSACVHHSSCDVGSSQADANLK